MTGRALALKPWQVLAALSDPPRLHRVLRPVVPEPDPSTTHFGVVIPGYRWWACTGDERDIESVGVADDHEWRNPLGSPGTVLWGQETWGEVIDTLEMGDDFREWIESRRHIWVDEEHYDHAVIYLADGDIHWTDGDGFPAERQDGTQRSYWRSSTQMPRKYASLTFRVTDTGVVRLGEVTEEEAMDYGMNCPALYESACDQLADQWGQDYPKHPWAPERWAWWAEVEVMK